MKPIKDMNETILKVGDRIVTPAGIEWEIMNMGGVTLVARRGDRKEILETKVVRKFDFSKVKKV